MRAFFKEGQKLKETTTHAAWSRHWWGKKDKSPKPSTPSLPVTYNACSKRGIKVSNTGNWKGESDGGRREGKNQTGGTSPLGKIVGIITNLCFETYPSWEIECTHERKRGIRARERRRFYVNGGLNSCLLLLSHSRWYRRMRGREELENLK